MSKISAFRPEDCTFIADHSSIDGYLYKYLFDSKLQTQIKDSSTLIAGNRLFNSFMTGSDGTALRLSFDGTNYLDTYIMYGGLYVHNDVDGEVYKADGAMIFYCVDPVDHTIAMVKKVNLCDNTNACMSPESFVQPTTFMSASCYVTLDDDCTSAIMVSVGGLTPAVDIQDLDFKYDYINAQNSLKEWNYSNSAWRDMTLYDIKGANTGWVVHGYGGRNIDYIQYGQELNLRTGTSSKQHEYSWNAIAGYSFGYHLGGLWFYGDDHQGSAFYNRYAFRMPIYFDSYPQNSVSNISSLYRGILFGHGDTLYMYGGGYEYYDSEDIYALNLVNNSQSSIYWCPQANGPRTRKNFDGVKHPTKPLMYFFGGDDHYGVVLDSVQVYDIVENVLSNLSPMPVGLHHHTATIVNDRVYIIGGMISPDDVEPDERIYNTNIYEYNITLDCQKTVKTGVRPRYKHTAAEYDGTIYLIGGLFGNDPNFHIYHEIDAFVVKTNSNMPGWKYIDIADRDLTIHQATTIEYDGNIYFFGGSDDGTSMVRFNPETLEWTKLADNTISASEACRMAAIDGTIFITGGQDYADSTRLICYIIDEDRWEEGPTMPVAHSHPQMLAHDGTIWVRVGYKNDEYAAELYAFDITRNEQDTKAIGIVNRSDVQFTAVEDSTKIWVLGGKDVYYLSGYFNPLTTIEVYDTQTDTQSVSSETYGDYLWSYERAKATVHQPIVRDGKIWLFGGQDNYGKPAMTTEIFNPVAGESGMFEVGDGVFGGGEPMPINPPSYYRYEDYYPTIGTFVLGDKLQVFYGGDCTVVGVYTFPEAFTSQTDSIVQYTETGFFDAGAFNFARPSYFLDTNTRTFKKIFAINPYPQRFGHHSVKMGSDILSMGGILKRNVSMIDQFKIPPITISQIVIKDLTNSVDLIADITNGDWGLGSTLTGKPSDYDFGSDATAGVDGWYALINIPPTDDMTNIVFEVIGGSITRAVLHYPNETPVYDQNGLAPPVDVSLVGVSKHGPICAYLGVPQGTVIKHIQCSK